MKISRKEQKEIRGGNARLPRNVTCELFSGQLFTVSGSCASPNLVWSSCYAVYGNSLSCARCGTYNICI